MNGNGPEEAPGNSLESAALYLRAGCSAIPPESPGEWTKARDHQTRQLLAWARQAGCIKPGFQLLPPSEFDGAEHRVGFDAASQRWIKTTKPGLYGMAAHIEHTLDKKTQLFIRRLEYGHALPAQYLDRLILTNEVFGDDVKLRFIVETSEGPSIETSQPHISGHAASMREIFYFMSHSGFVLVPNSGPTWYRSADNLLVIDAHEWNFIKTSSGNLLPFDLGIQRPAGELFEFLANN